MAHTSQEEYLDRADALHVFFFEVVHPLVAASSDGTINAKDLLKQLAATMQRGRSAMAVAAMCLTSSGKVAEDNLTPGTVVDMLLASFNECKGSDGRVSVVAAISSESFKAWSAATGFRHAATNDDTEQHVNNFNEFEELSRICELGGDQSAMCLLKSSWLQEQMAEVRRSEVPFVMPSRNALPPCAAYKGHIAQDRVFIVALSYCWAGPGEPDPQNRLLSDVCEMLAYIDRARHYGEDDDEMKKCAVGDREVLIFWDYPCLFQKSDVSTRGVTLLQLDSFQRGLQSINVVYAHVATLCLLCTQNYPVVVRSAYEDSAWPFFEKLVSMLIKDQNMAVDLPAALEWIRMCGSYITSTDPNTQYGCSMYWLYQHVRRAHRQLPVAPSTFDAEIVHKTATNGSDITFLQKKYRQTFQAVMEPAQWLELMDVPGPTSAQWRLFLTTTLLSCPRLVHVNLEGNEAIANATLEPFATLHRTLGYLNLGVCAGFGGSLEPLRHHLQLRSLILYGCVALEGSVEPLAGLVALMNVDVEACFGLVGGLHLLSPLPQLQYLNISDTQLDAAAFIVERERALQDSAVNEEGGVTVGGCWVGRDWGEYTPLMRAAQNGQAETARRLLVGRDGRGGVEVDRAEKRMGETPLITAANEGFDAVARVLIEKRANINKADDAKTTPILMAAAEGHVTIVRLLLEHSADTTIEDQWGSYPLSRARARGHNEVVALLVA